MPISTSTLVIDLSKIRANYNYLKSISKAETAGVLKANAYGLGSQQVASALLDEGCKIFFVAHLQEGIALRAALKPSSPEIYVLNGVFESEEDEFINYDLVPILNSYTQAKIWSDYAKRIHKKLDCLIHADSGINRLGMDEVELESTAKLQGLEVLYLMSHLACADLHDHEMNLYQLNKFKSHHHFFPSAKYSFANSGGIFLGENFHFDLTRPGIALYGGSPLNCIDNPMQNPVTLTSRIIQIRDIKDDPYVGYGATHKATSGSKIAIVPLGYADGIHRFLSNKGAFFIKGQKAPIVGRVSMDLMTIDVSDIECSLGNEVEIIGTHMDLEMIAKLSGTIVNEIITCLGTRSQRIYLDVASK